MWVENFGMRNISSIVTAATIKNDSPNFLRPSKVLGLNALSSSKVISERDFLFCFDTEFPLCLEFVEWFWKVLVKDSHLLRGMSIFCKKNRTCHSR